MPSLRILVSQLRRFPSLNKGKKCHRCLGIYAETRQKSDDNDGLRLGATKPEEKTGVQTPKNVSQITKTAPSSARPRSISKQQLTNYVLHNLIFENEHILAINKPNGLPIFGPKDESGLSVVYLDTDHSGESAESFSGQESESGEEGESNEEADGNQYKSLLTAVQTSLALVDILPDLQQHVNSSQLDIGMPLSRLYSGIVIMTKTEESKKKLRQYLETTRSQKLFYQTFRVLTIGTPSGLEETLEEVRCKQLTIDGQTLTIPADEFSKNLAKRNEIMRLMAQSKTVCTSQDLNCTLFNIKPTKDKWDVIEWYCTQRLCTALGDHIYSPRVGSVLGVPAHVEPHVALPTPQILPKKILDKLRLQEDQTSSLPLHVHRHSVEIRGIPTKNAQPIILTAPLPEFFTYNMKSLGLSDSIR